VCEKHTPREFRWMQHIEEQLINDNDEDADADVDAPTASADDDPGSGPGEIGK